MKKLLIGFIIVLMSFGLVACGNSKEDKVKEPKKYISDASFVYELLSQKLDQDTIDGYLDMNDDKLDYVLITYDLNDIPLKTTATKFKSVLEAWVSAKKDFGDIKSMGSFSTEKTNQGIEVKTEVKFKHRKATMTFTFDEKEYLLNLNINGHYSGGEIAKKAGMNTLLGMGTVFIMLIFISFVIYLFNYLPGGEKLRARKAKQNAISQNESDDIVIESDINSNSEDEIIAVISAAISATMDEENVASDDKFVVRSIKRRSDK